MEKQRVVSDDGYLFINRWIRDKFLETGDEELRKLKDFTIQMYRVLCEDVGICADKGVWNMFRSHNLRKFFNNRLIAARCDPMIKEFLMGHKIPDKTKASYFVADPTELKELYKDFIPFLMIQKEADVSESPEYIRIKQENQILATETARHVIERKELQDLRAELEKATQKIMEADAEIHYMNEDRDLIAEAKYQEKIKEMDEKMKALDSILDEAGKKIDVKGLKERTKGEVDW